MDILERGGKGLNLCYETRMGILNHTHGAPDDTQEATTVRLCDRIAYVNHDLDDSIRAGILTAEDVPDIIRRNCGDTNSRRINAILTDLITHSGGGKLAMSPRNAGDVRHFSRLHVLGRVQKPRGKGGGGARSRGYSPGSMTTMSPTRRRCRRTSAVLSSARGVSAPRATIFPA